MTDEQPEANEDTNGGSEPPGASDSMAFGSQPSVIVVGGGLAGLAAAHELAHRRAAADPEAHKPGAGIAVFEAKKLLGGKARSTVEEKGCLDKRVSVSWTDKGYHIFPRWYWDMWNVMQEAGITTEGAHARCTRKHCVLQEGSHGRAASRFTCPKSPASRDYTLLRIRPDETCEAVDTSRYAPRTVIAKLATLAVMLGLVGADPEKLDRRSLEDHLAGRWYAGNKTLERVREIVLKALANPSVDASARTTANTFRRWLPVYMDANWRSLRGPLQAELVDPWAQHLEELGVEFHKGRPVKEIRMTADQAGRDSSRPTARVRKLLVGGADDGTQEIDANGAAVVLAVPPQVLHDLTVWDEIAPPAVDPAGKRKGLQKPDPGTAIREVTYLEAAPMAALDLYLSELPLVGDELHGFPEAHFSLVDSQYAITGFAASEVWRDEYRELLPPGANHLVQFVCSDVGTLVGLDEADALELLRADIGRFIPELGPAKRNEDGGDGTGTASDSADPVVEAVLLMNSEPEEQVTRNEAGTWEKRPSADVGFTNAWLAGDYCRCPVDVASMEAAVSSGLLAADEVARSVGLPEADRPKYPAPVRGWPRGGQNRFWRTLIALIAFIGAGTSFVVGTVLRVLTLPYVLARRYATQNLAADPLRRRRRDDYLMCAGLAVVPVGLGIGLSAIGYVDGFDPKSEPYSNLGQIGSEGRWVLAIGCWILYLLLMLFAVPTRRFLPWSRQTTTGIMIAGLGYLLFPFFPVQADGEVPFMHVVTAVAILVGPNWSVIASHWSLEHPEPAYKWLGRLSSLWAVASTVVVVLTIVLSLLGVLTFWMQVAAIAVGHLWVTALALYLLVEQGPARSKPGRAVEPVLERHLASAV